MPGNHAINALPADWRQRLASAESILKDWECKRRRDTADSVQKQYVDWTGVLTPDEIITQPINGFPGS